MTPGLMLDTNQDVRTLSGILETPGLVAVARPLFAGATDAQGQVPQPVATRIASDEVAAILAAGLAFLPYANNLGTSDLLGDYAHGQAKAAELLAAARAIGQPAGSYIALDLEAWPATGAFLQGLLDAMAASEFAGAGIVYGSIDGAWRGRLAALQAAGVASAVRAVQWLAEYTGGPWDGQAPAWPDWAGASTFGWQFTDQGPQGCDLSLIRLPVFAVGVEGLWLPGGGVGSPVLAASPKAPDVPAAVAHLKAALGDLGA